MSDDVRSGPRYTLWRLVLYAAKLGSIGFGGPVGLIGYMYRDLVERRKWISEAAGIAFVLPSFLMVVALGWLYLHFGGLGWMQAAFYGVGAAVVGIIAMSAYKLVP